MKLVQRNLVLESSSDEPAHAYATHLVTRLVANVRRVSQKYRGARVSDGNAIFSVVHEKHSVTVICGRDTRSGALAVRVMVFDNVAAQWAVFIFPFAAIMTFFGLRGVVPSMLGTAVAMIGGFVIGGLMAFIVFLLADKLKFDKTGAERAASQIAERFERAIVEAAEGLGLSPTPADVELAGIDRGPIRTDASPQSEEALRQGDSKAWSAVMSSAIAGIPH